MSDLRLAGLGALVLAVLALGLLAGGDLALLLAGAAIATLIAIVLVSVYILRPLETVVGAARQLADGDFSARVRSKPKGAPGRLADAFNRMAQHVQEQMAEASQERSRLAAALNSSIDAVAALDRDGRILFANLGFEQTFGTSSEEVVGEPVVWVLADEQVLESIRDSRDRGLRHINLIERPGRRFLQVVTTPIAGGGEWSVLLVCHDLTDVKRTELIRRDFVANVSHELRTPLAGIKSVVETLEAGALDEPAVAREFLRRADEEVERLVLMVEELLELSRIESGDQPLSPEDTDVAALLADVARRLQTQAERAEVELRVGESQVGTAYFDATRIERALVNLAQNAIKFTPAGGTVSLSARKEGHGIAIEVEDTGIGIDSEDLPRIFERFYKVDQSRASIGSGLGLALVKHAVEAQGGSVQVKSSPGVGSTFTVIIPLPH